MKQLIAEITCWLKGHDLDNLVYYDTPIPMGGGFMHFGLIQKCKRCGEEVEVTDDKPGLTIMMPRVANEET